MRLLILVGPFLLLGASSLNVYVSTWMHAAALRLPIRPVGGVLKRLVAAGMLAETETPGREKDPGYLPPRSRERLAPAPIIEALERLGEEIPLPAGHAADRGETLLSDSEGPLRREGNDPSLLSPAR